MSFEHWTDLQVRQAQERGEFDNLPGKGKPLPNIDDHDDMWWIRQWLRRENLSVTPPTIAIRKSVEDTLASIERLRSETRVREVIGELNQRIRELNRKPPVDGPPSSVSPLDEEWVVALWRGRRAASAEDEVAVALDQDVVRESEGRRDRWYRRRRVRRR